MRFMMILCAALLVATPAFAQEKTKEIKPPATGWRSDNAILEAEKEIAQGAYEEALDTLEEIIERNLANVEARALMGYAYFKLNDLKKARRSFDLVTNIDPRHIGVYVYGVQLHLAEDDIREAEERLSAIKSLCKGTLCREYRYARSLINEAKKEKK